SVINKMVKQRRDSISQFRTGGRDDLVAIETAEIAVLEEYLPEQLGDAEVDALIDKAIGESGATSIRDMGKVMNLVKARALGRADMGQVGARVKARLSGG
ncbi:MAG TPA: GatB/YqeY domain-containing protein, partial [Woeseiaceae bacterium]|nr:GatB/YqeY domain-containing protein [Woeseiaceae bacterium]